MKIVEATWERRNLGISAFEVTIEAEDSLSDVQVALESLDCDYAVVRVSIGRLDLYEVLMQVGFYYVETMIMLSRDLRPVEIPKYRKEINTALSLEPMDDKEFAYMLSRVKEGLYKTDRISLDPHFNQAQSANRYYWWLQDERAKGNLFYKLTYQGKYVGFQELKQLSTSEYAEEFVGIFPEYTGQGFAMGFTVQTVNYLRDIGACTLYTEVSSNNPISLQKSLKYGYNVHSYFNVFITHGTKRGAM